MIETTELLLKRQGGNDQLPGEARGPTHVLKSALPLLSTLRGLDLPPKKKRFLGQKKWTFHVDRHGLAEVFQRNVLWRAHLAIWMGVDPPTNHAAGGLRNNGYKSCKMKLEHYPTVN